MNWRTVSGPVAFFDSARCDGRAGCPGKAGVCALGDPVQQDTPVLTCGVEVCVDWRASLMAALCYVKA